MSLTSFRIAHDSILSGKKNLSAIKIWKTVHIHLPLNLIQNVLVLHKKNVPLFIK